jgi:outer membrane lipoprotein-sorting protein
MRTILRASLIALLAGSAGGAFADTTMDAETVLKTTLAGPTVPYAGEITITHWAGRAAHAEEARVYVGSPDRYRYEFLTPTGDVSRVVVGTGGFEYVLIPEHGKVLHGLSAHGINSRPSPAITFALLSSNYHISSPEPDEVAGRKVFVVELTPLAEGKPRERLWLDPQTGVVLALRRFGTKTPDAAALRFIRFEPNAEFEEDFFDVDLSTENVVKDHGLRDTNRPLEDLNRDGGPFPDSLPFGFVYSGGRRFQVQGETVTQLTYTDGLTVVSVFETARPVQREDPSEERFSFSDGGGPPLSLHSPIRIVHGKRGGSYFTVMGDSNEALLNALWQEWPNPPK